MFGVSKKRLWEVEERLMKEDQRIEDSFAKKIEELKKTLSQKFAEELSLISTSIKGLTTKNAEDEKILEQKFQVQSRHEERLKTDLSKVDNCSSIAVERITTLATRVEENNQSLDAEIALAKKQIEDMDKRAGSKNTEVENNFETLKENMQELHNRLNRMQNAISSDFYNLAAYREEKQKDSLRHNGSGVEWIIKGLTEKIMHTPEGQCLTSPNFSCYVPKVGEVHELSLVFYPLGERGGGCSLFLRHPVDAPWMRFNLTVGSQKRGPFDTIYKGPPVFCQLEKERNEGMPREWDGIRISVEFMPPMIEDIDLGEDRIGDALFSTTELVAADGTNQFFQYEKLMEVLESKTGGSDGRPGAESALSTAAASAVA